MAEIYLCASWSDGSVSHEAMQLDGRFPSQPKESGWRFAGEVKDGGAWVRSANDQNCQEYLNRVAARRLDLDGLTLVGWRRLSDSEHRAFSQDRTYREALEDVGGKLQHNMAKAKELHRAYLRHVNGDKLMLLDRQWVDAMAANKRPEADAIEAKRKAMRDRVNDPAIDAAKSIEELKAVTPIEG
jgi:hypothetical protein